MAVPGEHVDAKDIIRANVWLMPELNVAWLTASQAKVLAERTRAALDAEVEKRNERLKDVIGTGINLGAKEAFVNHSHGPIPHRASDFDTAMSVIGTFQGLKVIDRATLNPGVTTPEQRTGLEVCVEVRTIDPEFDATPSIPGLTWVPLPAIEGPIY